MARSALRCLPRKLADDAYVVSFYIWNEEQDPRLPTIQLNVNTESQVATAWPPETAKRAASSAGEARWNYAFWRHDGDVSIADGAVDERGAHLRRRWAEQIGTWVDELPGHDEAAWARVALTTEHFWDVAARVARRLHDEGVVVEVFGRSIPIVLHELEYFGAIVDANRAANPRGLIDDFERWFEDWVRQPDN